MQNTHLRGSSLRCKSSGSCTAAGTWERRPRAKERRCPQRAGPSAPGAKGRASGQRLCCSSDRNYFPRGKPEATPCIRWPISQNAKLSAFPQNYPSEKEDCNLIFKSWRASYYRALWITVSYSETAKAVWVKYNNLKGPQQCSTRMLLRSNEAI